MTRSVAAPLFAAIAAVLALIVCIQLRCETDRRLLELERRPAAGRQLEGLVPRLAAIEGQMAQQFREPSGSKRSMAHWWCHGGHAACFRDRDECGRLHQAGIAGCEPRRVAYCTGRDCYADLDVCQLDEAGKLSRFCSGVE